MVAVRHRMALHPIPTVVDTLATAAGATAGAARRDVYSKPRAALRPWPQIGGHDSRHRPSPRAAILLAPSALVPGGDEPVRGSAREPVERRAESDGRAPDSL